ncbi:MAG: hypothetical protein OES12_08440 [Anaerolineae bacterium]|nr:hypothetical protein [Anaerolineae bacterium]
MQKKSIQLIVILSILALLIGLTLSLAYAKGTRLLFPVDKTDAVPASSYPSFLTDVEGILFFSATDSVHGTELWMTDGTPAGTKLVADIYPGPEGSFPADLTNVNGTLFFSADDGVHGTELWISNGTRVGTKLFADLDPGSIALFPVETPALITPAPIVVPQPTATQPVVSVKRSMYILEMGNQHLYQEPWGGDRGNPCEAWRTGNFDDSNPNHRGFNLELKLTNNSSVKLSDEWAENLSFLTADGRELTACYYGYDGMGPAPKATTSVTFFTVVPRGDYVTVAELEINGELLQLCFDGRGNAFQCR